MASRENKGKEVATSSKGFKSLMKGVAPISLVTRAPLARRFGVIVVQENGLNCNGFTSKQRQGGGNLKQGIQNEKSCMKFLGHKGAPCQE
ncbi:hypothetical protein HAX54_010219, partial [Datura stramonium]|nr:hypothetical protein [Datura stramonium]